MAGFAPRGRDNPAPMLALLLNEVLTLSAACQQDIERSGAQFVYVNVTSYCLAKAFKGPSEWPSILTAFLPMSFQVWLGIGAQDEMVTGQAEFGVLCNAIPSGKGRGRRQIVVAYDEMFATIQPHAQLCAIASSDRYEVPQVPRLVFRAYGFVPVANKRDGVIRPSGTGRRSSRNTRGRRAGWL